MGHCHGAVLLLTKKALESDWVLKEATNLLWRKGLSEQKFRLIPVYLDVTSSEVAQCKRFQPLELTEVQGLKGLEGVAAAKELVNLFAPLRKQQVDTPQRLLEEKISNILRPIGKNLLERVVNSLGEELGGWAPDRDDHGRTAMLLLQAPLEKLLDALKPIVGVISKESLDSLIDILRGCWVKREIASMLTLVARQPRGTRAATLNATRQHFTANAVVVRAAVQHPAWTIIQLSPSTDEDQESSFRAQIDAALEKLAGSQLDATLRSEFLEELERSDPVVVVAPPPDGDNQDLPPDDSVVSGLLHKYPPCTFLLLTGASLPAADRLKTVTPLELESGEESRANIRFAALQTRLKTQN
jgi:hypothetical protein